MEMKYSNGQEIDTTGLRVYRKADTIVMRINKAGIPVVIADHVAVVSPNAAGLVVPDDRQQTVLEYDPSVVIPILDPTTGDATGAQMSADQLLATVHSVFAYMCANCRPSNTYMVNVVDMTP